MLGKKSVFKDSHQWKRSWGLQIWSLAQCFKTFLCHLLLIAIKLCFQSTLRLVALDYLLWDLKKWPFKKIIFLIQKIWHIVTKLKKMWLRQNVFFSYFLLIMATQKQLLRSQISIEAHFLLYYQLLAWKSSWSMDYVQINHGANKYTLL